MRKSKYNSVSTRIDGYFFSSLKEAKYYNELKLRKRVGDVKSFTMQPRFKFPCGITYVADFKIVHSNNKIEIVDVKGFKTSVYKLKLRMFQYHYPNLLFKEI